MRAIRARMSGVITKPVLVIPSGAKMRSAKTSPSRRPTGDSSAAAPARPGSTVSAQLQSDRPNRAAGNAPVGSAIFAAPKT
jgi:hypothetical protein